MLVNTVLECVMTNCVLCVFLMVLWVGLQIVAFPGHTHLLVDIYLTSKGVNTDVTSSLPRSTTGSPPILSLAAAILLLVL